MESDRLNFIPLLLLEMCIFLTVLVIILLFVIRDYRLQLNNLINESKRKENDGVIYTQNPILGYSPMESQHPGDEIKAQQDGMKVIISKHEQCIKKWNKCTQEMNNEYKECKNKMDNEQNQINAELLLSSYSKCKSLWQQQQNRMESVSDFISEVATEKYKLKKCVVDHEQEVSNATKQCTDEEFKHKETQKIRKKLQEELRKKLMQLNECCEDENVSNEKKCKLLNSLNELKVELNEYKTILEDCPKLIHQYREFDKLNDKNINEMQKYFENKWIYCMKNWSQWNSSSIICWIKYLRENGKLTLSNGINLGCILKQMKNDKVDGNSLINLDKSDLKSVGFEILNDRKRVYNKIQQLISKYPSPKPYDVEGKNNDNNTSEADIKIPNEFICPLSKKIMANPVKIFDGNSYEKSEIESYLNKYKKSPIIEKCCDCDDDDIWYQPNRKLKQKINAFLSVNPQFLNDMNEVNNTFDLFSTTKNENTLDDIDKDFLHDMNSTFHNIKDLNNNS